MFTTESMWLLSVWTKMLFITPESGSENSETLASDSDFLDTFSENFFYSLLKLDIHTFTDSAYPAELPWWLSW